MLKVWGRTTSVNVQKVMWTIAELGLPHERIDAGGAFGKTDTPEYLAKNPNKLIPTLQDDDFVLWESSAIVRYLARKYGDGNASAGGRAAGGDTPTSGWSGRRRRSTLTSPPRSFSASSARPPRTATTPRSRPAFSARASASPSWMRFSQDRPYILGDKLTLADIPAGGMMYRYFKLPIARPSFRTSKPGTGAWQSAPPTATT